MSTLANGINLFFPALDFPSIIGYNVRMSTTTRNPILLPLPSTTADRAAFLYTALDAGWVRVQYRKNDGTRVSRVCTRNPSIVGTYGTSRDVRAIRESALGGTGFFVVGSLAQDNIVYFDYMAGGLRSFRVSQVEVCGIDAECVENNH